MQRLFQLKSQLVSETQEESLVNDQGSKEELKRYKNYSYVVAKPKHREMALSILIESFKNRMPLIVAYSRLRPDYNHENHEVDYWGSIIDEEMSNGLSVVVQDR